MEVETRIQLEFQMSVSNVPGTFPVPIVKSRVPRELMRESFWVIMKTIIRKGGKIMASVWRKVGRIFMGSSRLSGRERIQQDEGFHRLNGLTLFCRFRVRRGTSTCYSGEYSLAPIYWLSSTWGDWEEIGGCRPLLALALKPDTLKKGNKMNENKSSGKLLSLLKYKPYSVHTLRTTNQVARSI